MAFYAKRFIFDDIPSESHSLLISSADSSGAESTDMPANVTLFTQKIFRRTDEYLYGVSTDTPLEFPVNFFTEKEELTAIDLELIGGWLFGRKNYCKLRIMQEDMSDVYYDCFLLDPKIIRVGNIIRGVSAKVHCRTVWGLTDARTYTTNLTSFSHKNLTDDRDGYTYPILSITTSIFGGDISITNVSDNNRTSTITGLLQNEVITLDNNLQIITSSTGLRRLSNFNKNFFRLLPGTNNVTLTNIASLSMTYSMARKVGG